MSAVLEDRLERLRRILRELDPLAVGFSGGVDSSLLLAVAREVLGDRVLAVTGVSPSLSGHQREQARRVASALGVRHLELATEEMGDPRYAANPSNRCFFCKHELWERLRAALGPEWPHLADGSNADDRGDHRPGQEAGRRAGVRSPLLEAGLSKAEVRELSRRRGLETAELPASPCLASRLPYGLEVTPERLGAVERGEDVLRASGLREFRLRHLGDRGRVELAAAERERLLREGGESRLLAAVARAAGLAEVFLDPRPLRSGRLNEPGEESGASAGSDR